MTDAVGPQNCPHDDCRARYAAAVVEAHDGACPTCAAPVAVCPLCTAFMPRERVADGGRCPRCHEALAPCPVCATVVSVGRVHDEGKCPACGMLRLALGEAWREREQALEVGE